MARKKVQWFMRGSWWRRIRLNRKYKDKLFRFLFRDKKDLLELYNALNGTHYKDPDELEIVTLEDVIFLKMKNDLSFIIARRINLYEHQSTLSQNLPLRGLIYFREQRAKRPCLHGHLASAARVKNCSLLQFLTVPSNMKESYPLGRKVFTRKSASGFRHRNM